MKVRRQSIFKMPDLYLALVVGLLYPARDHWKDHALVISITISVLGLARGFYALWNRRKVQIEFNETDWVKLGRDREWELTVAANVHGKGHHVSYETLEWDQVADGYTEFLPGEKILEKDGTIRVRISGKPLKGRLNIR